MNRARRTPGRMLAVAAGAGLLALAVVPSLPPSGAAAETAAAAAPGAAFAQTRTIGREVLGADGQPDATLTSSYRMTVKADRTTNLRGRERVEISWSGARPSAGRALNPYGEKGLLQEYPVVVMQCRGTDDPSLPADQQLRPETCWTSSVAQRTQRLRSKGEATWTVDRYADAADRLPVSGMDPFPDADCPGLNTDLYFTHLTEYVGAGGTTYPACAASKMPPEAAIDAAFPASELAAFTDVDGKGSVKFEVRSDVENESLGCSHDVACSIVVVPILGISCDVPAVTPTTTDKACRKSGRFAPGSSNYAEEGVDQAVSPSLWWSASNWRNRFTIPITFGLPAGVCDVLDPRAPTSFYGSELMAQAALQWAPAYCLREDRFKFELSQMPDQAGWNNMEGGTGPAAFVSSAHEQQGTDPVGYAPTAVTGFGIGYVIDKPNNAGEFTDLRLTPRLLAKLLTQSYLGSDLGRAHPGITGNPLGIMADPEFTRLNPGLSEVIQESGATLLSLSVSSDIVRQVTAYIAQDKDAAAFMAGTPDRWGMRINPAYENLSLPVDEWPLLDTYVPETQNECLKQNPSVYFTQLASPVSTLRTISDALIDAWPNVQTRCDYDTATSTYKLGRRDRQGFGTRFMLGLVSLGDADRFGLRSASLLTSGGSYVAPTDASLTDAVRLMRQRADFGPFEVSQDDLVAARTAYPGTMVVYTAARLTNLPKADAANVASFIRIATREGQVIGRGNGDLPGGYLPLRRTGATAALWRAAQDTAEVIAAQELPEKPAEPEVQAPTPPGADVVDTVPEAPSPADQPAGDRVPTTATDEVAPTAATVGVDSAAGNLLLPGLLLVGGLALVSALVSQVVGRRGWERVVTAVSEAPVRAPAEPRRRAERPPRAPQPMAQGPVAVVSSVSIMLALLCGWAILHLLLFAQVSHDRSQSMLFDQFRVQLAAATAPIDASVNPGEPVSLLQIPEIGVDEVVVEGTAAGDLFAGPGHKRSTVLPGQVGTATVYGRAATYGAPFADLAELSSGDAITVVTGQGEKVFHVIGVRREGDPVPAARPDGAARLTLVTAEGAGTFAGIRPGAVLYVDAEAPEGFPVAGSRSPVVPESEEALARGTESLPTLCLGLGLLTALTLGVIAARQRWDLYLVWVVAVPVAIALAWVTTDAAMRLFPNLI